MKTIQGFPSTMQDDFQLNLINIIKHGARNFEKQQIVCKTATGMYRYTYAEAYARMQRLASALNSLGIKVGDRVGVMDWNT
jgi:fatty-acyl-CoA synthase